MPAPGGPAVLIVDDDPILRAVLHRRLEREGYAVTSAPSGAAALRILEEGWPALAVIDLMMPGMDGFELARRIKLLADIPILILSSVDESEAKVNALERYAEDYVTKPFDADELVARVHRIVRRSAGGRISQRVKLGETEIDLVERSVSGPTGTHALTRTEARLLQALIGSLDRTVKTDALLERVWADADGADPSYVWVTVRRLRRKLEADPDRPRLLLTERGVGYRLASPTLSA